LTATPAWTRTTALAAFAVVVALVLAGCSSPDNPSADGGSVNQDPNTLFSELMKRPDSTQATQQYQQMNTELLAALSSAIPSLPQWTQKQGEGTAACGSDYPGIGDNGQTVDLPTYVAQGGVTDAEWEVALTTIGRVAAKYGFDATPQRLHDEPGDHDAVFHNVQDDGSITLDTAQNLVFGVSLGCHLTTVAKQRGHLSSTP
jgi:putative hemolysin